MKIEEINGVRWLMYPSGAACFSITHSGFTMGHEWYGHRDRDSLKFTVYFPKLSAGIIHSFDVSEFEYEDSLYEYMKNNLLKDKDET